MFDIPECEDKLFANHIFHFLLAAKQYLYSCRQNRLLPSIQLFDVIIMMIHSLEKIVAKSNNKLTAHNKKRGSTLSFFFLNIY